MNGYVLDLSFSVRDLLLVVPAWTGAVVAILGLNAWRRQLRGKDDYELARRLLRATYRYRDSLRRARTSFAFESPKPGQTPRDFEREVWWHRFEPLENARRKLEAELLESRDPLGS